jgi:hypothetical protein
MIPQFETRLHLGSTIRLPTGLAGFEACDRYFSRAILPTYRLIRPSVQTWTRGRAHEATAAVAHPPPGVRSSPPAPEAQEPPAWPGASALSRRGSPRRRRPNLSHSRPTLTPSTRRASIAVRGRREPNPARRRVPVHRGAGRRRQRHVAGVHASTAVPRRRVRGVSTHHGSRRSPAGRRRPSRACRTCLAAARGPPPSPSTRSCTRTPATRTTSTVGVRIEQRLTRAAPRRWRCAVAWERAQNKGRARDGGGAHLLWIASATRKRATRTRG